MNIFIMALEPLDSRYTGQWFHGIPKLLYEHATNRGQYVNIENIAGDTISGETSEGAFLNFTATNVWKNSQVSKLAEMFSDGTVKPGDKILFTDAWHSGIIQVKYMSELTGVPVEIHSMWHAGSYDPADFLGRKIADKRWAYSAERSFFFASDYNYFATEFHRDMFLNTLFSPESVTDGLFLRPEAEKTVISGQPYNELAELLPQYRGAKRDLIVFPHRLAPEKQPEIFRDLAASMPEYEWVITQENKLNKDEYYRLLGQAKIVFSANLQETLGVSSVMEPCHLDIIPLVPDRLCYSEIYRDYEDFLYPSSWSTNWDAYIANKAEVVAMIRYTMENYDHLMDKVVHFRGNVWPRYGNADVMVKNLLA